MRGKTQYIKVQKNTSKALVNSIMVFNSARVVPANFRQSIESGNARLSEKSSTRNMLFMRNSIAARYSITTMPNVQSHDFSNHAFYRDDKDTEELLQSEKEKHCCSTSIKFVLLVVVVGLVLLSVLVLSATWLSSFVPTVVEFSFKIRKSQFEKMVGKVADTMEDVALITETVKGQIDNQFNDTSNLAGHLYQLYKSEYTYHDGLPMALVMGNTKDAIAMIQWGPTPAFLEIGSVYQNVYYCAGYAADYCIRSPTPNLVMPKFDLSLLFLTANNNPGKGSYTPSYSLGIDLMFVAYATSWMASGNTTSNIENVFTYSISLQRLNQFLTDITKDIPGSSSMIIEMESNYLIAVDNTTIKMAYLSNNTVVRYTGLDIDYPKVNTISNYIYDTYKNNLSSIPCNTYFYTSLGDQYVSLYRYCNEFKIDWVIVLATPQMNYISSTVLAVSVALIGSTIILLMSLVTGVIFSVKIVQPFYGLMSLFEKVSNMDLDDVTISTSSFSEVRSLQKHFIAMIKKIKLYRAFIPAHLIAEIESNENANQVQKNSQSTVVTHSLQSGLPSDLKSGLQSSGIKSSSSSKRQVPINRFALYLEAKKISILALYIEGLHVWFNDIGYKETVGLLQEVFEQVAVVSRTAGCHIGNFENDILTLTFNSSKDIVNHEEKALSASKLLFDKLRTSKETKLTKNDFLKNNPKFVDCIKFRIAMTSQMCSCGNIGTNDFKNFTIVSSAKYNMESLLEVAQRLDVSIVISQRMLPQANKSFQTRYIDSKDVLIDSFCSPPSFVSSGFQDQETVKLIASQIYSQEPVYEVGSSLKVEMDEVCTRLYYCSILFSGCMN